MEDDNKLSITTVVFILMWTLFAVSLFIYFMFQIHSSPDLFKDVVTIRFYSHPVQ